MASGNKQNKYLKKQKFCLEKVFMEKFSEKRKKCLFFGTGKNAKYGRMKRNK